MTTKRPAGQLIRSFRTAVVGADTIGDHLSASHSLVICCKDCPRIVQSLGDNPFQSKSAGGLQKRFPEGVCIFEQR